MPVQCTCLHCGCVFDSYPNRINTGRGRYCSRACADIGHRGQLRTFERRFWARVDKTANGGCWEWRGGANGHGYGRVRYQDREQGAHRVSWQLANGPIPDGLWVLHRCDNPPCVNPEHLFLGTSADNTADKVAKGRQRSGVAVEDRRPRGETHGYAKLTAAQVLDIRAIVATGDAPLLRVARQFGVSDATIRLIVKRKTWRHL